MKPIIIACCCLLFLSQSNGQQIEKVKRALVIAIGNYPEKGGWSVISSKRDAVLIKKTLYNQGFLDENVEVLSDAAATISGINRALSQLVERVQRDDVVLIHFSSHGEQVEADNSRWLDNLDECIVAYDAIAPNPNIDFSFLQKGYLRGYVIGNYLKQIRSKLGKNGDVLVVMDCCHSGNGTRSIAKAKVRGGLPPLVSASYNAGLHTRSDSSVLARVTVSNSSSEIDMASYEVISASRPEELSVETVDDNGEEVGSLSYAFAKVFPMLNKETTYRTFFAMIQSVMNVSVPNQHPLLEGNGVDRVILGGAFIFQKPFVEIDSIKSDTLITLKGGMLAGLNTGAKISLYPSGTNDSILGQRIAYGTVVSADNFTSTIAIYPSLTITQPSAAWAFIAERQFAISNITMQIGEVQSTQLNASFSKAATDSIKKSLQQLPYIKFEGTPVLLLTKGTSGIDSIKIAVNGYLFDTITNAAAHTIELRQKIQQYAQKVFLEKLDLKDNTIDVQVKLVPVINGQADVLAINKKIVNGIYEFYEGDSINIWVKNIGLKDAYVNILDIQPNGIINPVLPNKFEKIYPYNLKIAAGQEFLFSNYTLTIAPPFGTEVFKVFASATEIDLESIATTKGQTARGNLSPLELLIKKSYGSRGAASISGNASTTNILFRIKERK